jgi:N-hydroxyarylamine O-acetyltransferase
MGLEGLMDETTLEAYFGRLAVPRPHAADAVNLHVLHRAHQMVVPFENLSIHLSEPVLLAEDVLVDKIVTRRRGGFCYELNGAFAILLETMGADVRRVAARVYGGDGRAGPPLDHMALVVRASDASGPWLIDVGFGSHSVYPLLFDSRHEQDDPAGRFLLLDGGDGDVDVLKDGKPQYRIEPRERSLADFIPTCWWQTTSPDSHFTRDVICSRLTRDGRVSIAGHTLIITENGSRAEQQLTDDEALLAAYREHFGIILDTVPRVIRAPSAAAPPAPSSPAPSSPAASSPAASSPAASSPAASSPAASSPAASSPAASSPAAPSPAAPPSALVLPAPSAPLSGAGSGPSPLSGPSSVVSPSPLSGPSPVVSPSPLPGPSPLVSPGGRGSGFPDGVVVRETDAGRVELL